LTKEYKVLPEGGTTSEYKYFYDHCWLHNINMSSKVVQYTLPDLFSLCPFDFSKPSPYLQECSAESREWVTRFNVLNEKQHDILEKSQSGLLCALTYPYAGREGFKTTCDFINLLFVLDHVSDDMNSKDANGACEVFYEVMADPDFKHESNLAKITLEYAGSRLARCASY
jgi:hypothetical protein